MDPLAQYQQDLKNLLLGDPALAVVPVYKLKEQNTADVAAQDLGPWQVRVPGKLGVAIEIDMPSVRGQDPNVGGPQLFIEFNLRIFEDPTQNNTGLTCEGAGLEVLQWLDGQIIGDGPSGNGLELYADDKGKALAPEAGWPDRFCYKAVLVSKYPRARPYRAMAPVITWDGAGNITLTNSDGASIYYTTDGSMPLVPIQADGSAGAVVAPTQLYAAPFNVPTKTAIRWFAWQPNFQQSFVGYATVTY